MLFHYASVASFDDIKMMEVVAAIDSGATQSLAHVAYERLLEENLKQSGRAEGTCMKVLPNL